MTTTATTTVTATASTSNMASTASTSKVNKVNRRSKSTSFTKSKRFSPIKGGNPFAPRMPAGAYNIDFTKLPLHQQRNKMGINVIECFACAGNVPSTYEVLASHRLRIYPTELATPGKIKDHILQWSLDCMKYGMKPLNHGGVEGPETEGGFRCTDMRDHIVCTAKSGHLRSVVRWIDEKFLPIFNNSGSNTYPVDAKTSFSSRKDYRVSKDAAKKQEQQQQQQQEEMNVFPSPPITESDKQLQTSASSSATSATPSPVSSSQYDNYDSFDTVDSFDTLPTTPESMYTPSPYASERSFVSMDSPYVQQHQQQQDPLYQLFNDDESMTFMTPMPAQIVQSLDELFASIDVDVDVDTQHMDQTQQTEQYSQQFDMQFDSQSMEQTMEQEVIDINFWRNLGM